MTYCSASSDTILADLEKEIAKYMKTRYAVLCSSARSAIRFSLLALGVGHGDEVLVPDLVPQELPITVFCTGAKPVLCDVNRETCAMSFSSFQEAIRPKAKAVIYSQLYGLPADPRSIKEAAEERNIALIEDSSQALGAIINGRKAGTFGDVGILNFNKFLNVLLGAAITTNDEELALRIKTNRTKYETKSLFTALFNRMMERSGLETSAIFRVIFLGDKYLYKLMHETFSKKYFTRSNGWIKTNSEVLEKWRANSLTAPMINQLIARADGRYWQRRKMEKMELLRLKKEFTRLDEYFQNRQNVAKLYEEYLKPGEFEKIPVPPNSLSAYKKYPIIFSESSAVSRCVKALRRAGFKIDYRYRPLHLSPFFREIPQKSEFREATYLSEHLLPLPVTPNMSPEEIRKVAFLLN